MRLARWRHSIGLIGLGVFLLFFMLRAVDLPLYVFFTRVPDGVAKPMPFADLLAILQAGDCWRHGVDVYRASACLHNGVFNYAPLLLRAAYLPIGPRDTIFGGVLFCLVFLVSLGCLPTPKSVAEFAVRLAAVLSLTTFYALEQGNFDVAIFSMTVLGIRLIISRRSRTVYGYAIFLFLAALKFYPVALLVLIVREPVRKFVAIVFFGFTAAAILIALYAHDAASALRIIPSSIPFRATFGRIDIPRGLNLLHILTANNVNHLFSHGVFPSGTTLAAVTSYIMSTGALLAAIHAKKFYIEPLRKLDIEHFLFLIAGSAVIFFCFFAAQNVYYRAIFLILTIPGLWRISQRDRHCQILLAAIVLLLWEALPRAILHGFGTWPVAFWLFRECLWWWVVIQLGGLILAFAINEYERLCLEAKATKFCKIALFPEKL